MIQMKNHYQTLGIDRDAPQQQIKEAYHKLALEWHPDKNGARRDQAVAQFQQINEAYSTLSKSESKKNYDTKLEAKEWRNHTVKVRPKKSNEEFYFENLDLSCNYLTREEEETINKFLNRMEKSSKKIKKP